MPKRRPSRTGALKVGRGEFARGGKRPDDRRNSPFASLGPTTTSQITQEIGFVLPTPKLTPRPVLFAALSFWGFPQTYAGAAAVFVDELDTGIY